MPSEIVVDLILRAELYEAFSAAFREPFPSFPDRDRFRLLWGALPEGAGLPDLPENPADPEAELRRVFGHNLSPDCPPYETHYGKMGVFRKTQTLADLAGFYRAFGVEAAPGDRRADHLPVQLEFMALLLRKEARARERGDEKNAELCDGARAKFLGDHLAAWIPVFGAAVAAKAPAGYLPALIARLAAFVAFDAESSGISPGAGGPGAALVPFPGEDQSPEGCASCFGGTDDYA